MLVAAASLAVGTACDGLPEVEPGAFACVDDVPLSGGELPCGPDRWCVDGVCTPRLGCQETQGVDLPACEPGLRRCEPVVTPEVAAARCEGGVHTNTSTRPEDLDACTCPDGLHCVAYLDRPDQVDGRLAPDLRFLPDGGPAPGPEIPERRLCVRACSGEGNCSADHTCRPAAVTRDGTLRARDTIAVCYPNVLAETSSTSTVTQPLPRACRGLADCGTGEACRYDVVEVPDHPAAPLGATWSNRALVAQCAPRGALRGDGRSCTRGNECASGVCAGARCRAVCDPAEPELACALRSCVERVVERILRSGAPVYDRVHVCEL